MSDHLLSIASSRLVTPGMATAGPLFPAPMCLLIPAVQTVPLRQPHSNKQPSKASVPARRPREARVVWRQRQADRQSGRLWPVTPRSRPAPGRSADTRRALPGAACTPGPRLQKGPVPAAGGAHGGRSPHTRLEQVSRWVCSSPAQRHARPQVPRRWHGRSARPRSRAAVVLRLHLLSHP